MVAGRPWYTRVHDLRDISSSIRVEHYNVKYLRQVYRRDGDKSWRFFWLSEGPLETLLFLRSLNGIWKSCHDFDPRSNEEDFYKSYKLKFHYVGGMKICSKLCEISHKGWRLFFSSDLFFEKFLSIIDRILLNDK